MRFRHISPLLLLALPAVASAQTMSAEHFYQRSTALKTKGAAAIFSMGEIKKLMGEAQRAGQAARAHRLADVAAGRPARACPPEKASMDSNEFMRRLAAIPAADRQRIDMTEAMTRITIARFPCPR